MKFFPTRILNVFLSIFLLITLPARAIIDANNNGVSDLWEKLYNSGGLFSSFDPQADPDGDGWTNAQEAAAGTNPFDANPPAGFIYPTITHIPAVYVSPMAEGTIPEIRTPEAITITWETRPGKQYTLLFSPDLTSGSWIHVGNSRIGSGSEIGTGIPLTQPDGSVPPAMFWRVAVEDIDTDGDGLTNAEESETGTNPYLADGDGDGVSDREELFNYLTNPNSPDTDSDGVTDGDEILLYFTNPLTAADLDQDGIADDFEKCLSAQLLAFKPDAVQWGAYYTGLSQGNLDATHDYTGDGITAAGLASVFAAEGNTIYAPGNLPFLLESQERRNFLSGNHSPAHDGYPAHTSGTYIQSLSRTEATQNDLNELSQLTYTYLNSHIGSAVWVSDTLPTLCNQDYVSRSGGIDWSSAYFRSIDWPDGSQSFDGTFIQKRFRIFSKSVVHGELEQQFLRITRKSPSSGTGLQTVSDVDTVPLSIHNGRLFSDWVEVKVTMGDGQNTYENLEAVDLVSDLNNDGQIDKADTAIRVASMKSDAGASAIEQGTEYLFENDQLSNGDWDKDDSDPARVAAAAAGNLKANEDDDAQEITINPGITEGEVWLDHPAIAGLSFYKTRACNPADKVNITSGSKFPVSPTNPFPGKLFVRADGTIPYPGTDLQIEGDLVLKIKPSSTGPEVDAVKLKFTIVKEFGAKKYFHAARDYILENNTKVFTHDKDYGPSTKYRIVAMREESTDIFGLDTYDHAGDKPRLNGIDEVKANYSSDVIINGNQCWADNGVPGTSRPLPGGMTNRCDGRLCVGLNILRPPSDDTHHPLGGVALGRYVGYKSGDPEIINGQIIISSEFTFSAGQIPEANPATPDQGIGGLSTNYILNVRQSAENQAIGRGKVTESEKGIVFTATNYVGKGGKAKEFAADANNSGVQPLNGGDGDDWELLFLDGSSSVGLILADPGGVQKTLIKGGKHNGGLSTYYINTYLLFNCEKPRNQ